MGGLKKENTALFENTWTVEGNAATWRGVRTLPPTGLSLAAGLGSLVAQVVFATCLQGALCFGVLYLCVCMCFFLQLLPSVCVKH